MKRNNQLVKRIDETRELDRPLESSSVNSNGYGYGVENVEDNEVHLRDYWRAIRKRLWLVIGVTLLITMLVAVYVARKPDIYEARARVQVDLENNPALNNISKDSSIIVNPVNDPTYFNTQLQILSGSGLLRRVVKMLDLEHNQAFFNSHSAQQRSTWQNLLRMVGLGSKEKEEAKDAAAQDVPLTSSVAPATSRDDLVEAKRLAPFVGALQAGLKVEPVKERRVGYDTTTRLIDISYSHNDPQIAAKVINAVADAFAYSNLEKKTENTNSAGDFLQKRIAELQSQIRNAEERLINYAKNNQILTLDSSQNTVVDRLAALNKQLLEAENDRKTAEAAYKAAQAPGAATALAKTDAKQLDATEAKLAELKQKREQLLVDATDEAPEVKEVNQQIAIMEKQVKEMRSQATSTLLTNLETRYRQALQREQSLRDAFNKQKGETVMQNEAAINYRIIQQEIETNKTLLDGLLQSSKTNDVVLAGTPNNISVIDYALVPEGPVGPNRMRAVMLAMFLALCGGIGLALFLEYMDDSINSTEDIEKILRLPALAVIPAVTGMARRRLKQSSTALQKRNGSSSPELLINAETRSPLAEAYRQLRTSVLLSTAGGAPKTLLVTSSLPGEGKTTTAVNTALSLSQTGASVVIIDADMRRPRLQSIFNLKDQRGLSTILSSEMSEAEMHNLIQQHLPTGLHVLAAGPTPPNPAELIGSSQMRRFITVLESTFTHIVIDSPPINSFTDGVLLSSLVDGVILVVHGGKSSHNIVRRARQLLHDVGSKIFGVVLNNVDRRSPDYDYYRYYNDSYYTSEAAEADEVGPVGKSAAG